MHSGGARTGVEDFPAGEKRRSQARRLHPQSCGVFLPLSLKSKGEIMVKHLGLVLGALVLSVATFLPAPAQERLGERIGEKLDRGLTQLSRELREEWAQIKKSVERMGVHGRVYSRLRWDKQIQEASIDIEVRDESTVVLRGQAPSAAAKAKALQLAQDTVGVSQVIDEVTVNAPGE
jgi:hyperosmotically inducible periplasmic protein